MIDFRALSGEWWTQFEILSEAGEIYDPRKWERLWLDSETRWVLSFLSLAVVVSMNSTCFNRHAGAVLVGIKKQRNGAIVPFVLGLGFNGVPTGIITCTAGLGYCKYKKMAIESFYTDHSINENYKRELPENLKREFRHYKETFNKYCPAIHSEENAILFSSGSVQNKMLFSTTNPCPRCARLIVQKGIAAVVYSTPYKADSLGKPSLAQETENLFKEAKIPCVYIPLPENYLKWLSIEAKFAGKGLPDLNDPK